MFVEISLINRAIIAGRKQGRATLSVAAYPKNDFIVWFAICMAEAFNSDGSESDNPRRFSCHYFSDQSGFFWGDYDLTEAEALSVFKQKRPATVAPSPLLTRRDLHR
jgi:hypothetical protein